MRQYRLQMMLIVAGIVAFLGANIAQAQSTDTVSPGGACALVPSFCTVQGMVLDTEKCNCVEQTGGSGGMTVADQTMSPFDPASVKSNAIVEQLMQGSKKLMPDGTIPTITKLTGYVGPSSADTVRLYWDLSLSRYWEIPRSAILLQIPGNSPNDPVTLLVPISTLIVTANSMPADASVVQRAIIDGLGQIPIEGPGMGPGHPTPRTRSGELASIGHAINCVAGHMASCTILYFVSQTLLQ